MDYNLDSLGPRNFENLTQALVAKIIGPRVTVFGDGPDGGREATWRGDSVTFGRLPSWNGYGVLQAKFRERSSAPAENLAWLKATVQSELKEWARAESKRAELPDFLLFMTNVRLSSVPGSGKDEAVRALEEIASDLKLQFREIGLADYYDIRAMLDGAADIRKRYAAFITSGDVIATLLDQLEQSDKTLGEALTAYTARSLLDDGILNLTQSGTAGDARVTIGDVFVDLPANLPRGRRFFEEQAAREEHQRPGLEDADEGEAEETNSLLDNFESNDASASSKSSGIAAHLISSFNRLADANPESGHRKNGFVLIGGPGQGKSTVTQWLAEIYRAEFLDGSPVAETPDVKEASRKLRDRQEKLSLPVIGARRWPFRIVLTELADYLAKNPSHSLLHYIAQNVAERSSAPVDASGMRRWLASYPWLLLIDGLDEVPVSSNRDQVMIAIGDFFIDVAAIGADVEAVATTRPQGYSQEFSPNQYEHIDLASLNVRQALKYAEGLVRIRQGDGTPSAKKVMDRLRRASIEEHTSKLFESPLQVTILEVLLEKLGKAPSDRSRLYSAYYSVISAREQEKSGKLSDLLQRYESDVDWLHRRVGIELQSRGAEIGETTSSLSIDEFHELIRRRFKNQGHSKSEVATLVRDFSALVTDRLVFLARLQVDRIGFELRSLQEFMASEYIISLKESKIIRAIEERAVTPYWRNVVLFAIGSIFAHREPLRAEAVLLCERLNDASKTSAVLRPGSDLAIDVLRDGSCLSMPRYARSLAKNAIGLLRVPSGSHFRRLRFLLSTDLAELLWEHLESTQEVSHAHTINKAGLLSLIRTSDGDRADVALHKLWKLANDELKRQLVEWAWDTFDIDLAHVIGSDFMVASPETFGKAGRYDLRDVIHDGGEAVPDWIRHLGSLASPNDGDQTGFDLLNTGDTVMVAFARQLGARVDAWHWIAGLSPEDVAWQSVVGVAQFASAPSPETLARALDLCSRTASDPQLPGIPWPLEVCLRHAESKAGANTTNRERILSELAKAAERGDLGDLDSWKAAEERWGPSLPVTPALMCEPVEVGGLPLWPGLTSVGFLATAFVYGAKTLDGDAAAKNALSLLRTLSSRAKDHFVYSDLAVFLGSMFAPERAPSLEFVSDGVREEVYGLVRSALEPAGRRSRWIAWLNLVKPAENRPDSDLLRMLDAPDAALGRLDEPHVSNLFARSDDPDVGPEALRLALHAKPSLLAEPAQRLAEDYADSRPDLGFDVVLAAWNVTKGSSESLWSGALDESFLAIATAPSDGFSLQWFLEFLSAYPSNNTPEVAARGAIVAAQLAPSAAERLWEWASRAG
ncbi:hypothetical protein [Leifsonia sp. AG29]|uniref:hypothetical protein n=1 Tax=Leifsonia sp. AG29 TaxID=2598860 RepID=UPI00131DC104|nr:hypothetical protein [Leifsonia sp. AG29]